MIYEQIGDKGAAASSCHKTAWICDDIGDKLSSDFFRIRTAELCIRLNEGNEKIEPGNVASLKLIITDLYEEPGNSKKRRRY